VIVDRHRDLLRFSFGTEHEPADLALKLGELPYRAGHEVVLRQTGRQATASRLFLAQGEMAGKGVRKLLHPPGLVGVASDLRMEYDALELRRSLRERLPEVLVPEESRVLETTADDPLVPSTDVAAGISIGVGHANENRQEIASCALNREALLMVAERRREQLAGKLQKRGIEAAGHDPRPLHETGHLVEESAILDERAFCSLRGLQQGAQDTLASDRRIDDHERPLQRLDILIRVPDVDGSLAEEAVASRPRLRPDAEQLERQHGAPVNRQEPVHRPDPAVTSVTPPHRFRERHPCDRGRQGVPEDFSHRLALDVTLETHVDAFARFDPPQLRGIDSLLSRKAGGRLRRLAVGGECDLRRRTEHDLVPILLAPDDVFDPNGQAPRPAPRLRPAVSQPRALQAGRHEPGQIARGARDHPRRNLLAADLDEQRRRRTHFEAPRLAILRSSRGNPADFRPSSQASAPRHDSDRIRWM